MKENIVTECVSASERAVALRGIDRGLCYQWQ